MAKKKGKKTGRPQIEIDWGIFESLCKIQCTLTEIAGIFKCSVDTIERAVKRKYKETFADVYKRYSAEGKVSLRRMQWASASGRQGIPVKDENGNVVVSDAGAVQWVQLPSKPDKGMQIWLGKQILGQKEQTETTIPEGVDVRISYADGKGGSK